VKRAEIKTMVLEHTSDGVRRLRGGSNPDAGLVVAAIPPDVRRSYPITWELLEGLGKITDVSGAGRHEDLNWELVAAWILAHRVGHLVLVDAQWIPPRLFSDITGLAAVTGVTLWLVAHAPLPDSYAEAVEGWPTEVADPAALAALVSAALRPQEEEGSPKYPRPPADSYLTFRAEARRRLTSVEFALVDARLHEAYEEAAGWFGDQPKAAIDEDSVLAYLRRRLHGCASAEEMLIEVRGVQVAAHNADWLVSADVTRLVATAQNASAAAVHSPHTWRRLRAYREPYRGGGLRVGGLRARARDDGVARDRRRRRRRDRCRGQTGGWLGGCSGARGGRAVPPGAGDPSPDTGRWTHRPALRHRRRPDAPEVPRKRRACGGDRGRGAALLPAGRACGDRPRSLGAAVGTGGAGAVSTPVSPCVDGAFLRRRRAELGLSAREVADALGVSAPSYLALEGGHGTATVEFRTAARIAQILGLTLEDVVAWSTDPAAVDSPDRAPDGDAAALGALLHATGTLTPVGALCEALGWDYDRLHRAEEVLAERLASCGLRLHRKTARLSIARAVGAVDPSVLKSLVRRQLARENVSLAEARMIRRIQQGRAPRTPSNAESVTFGVLVNAELVTFVEPSRRGTEREMVLSEDVAFSLFLTEPVRRHRGPPRQLL
jgi:transcriptional regulator with XRE-family HTH domain